MRANLKSYPSKYSLSGDKSCYEQIYGSNAGCFKHDVTWCIQSDLSPTAQTIEGEEVPPTIWPNWGACAEECRKRAQEWLLSTTASQGCDYWTWASPSCTNCSLYSCILFKISPHDRNNIVEQIVEAKGHISGRKDCTDISFVEPSDTRSVHRHNATGNLEFSVGRCQTPHSPSNPQCQGQEVPGYR